MTEANAEDALQASADRQQISDVMIRYCRGVDRKEESLVREAYHSDSYDDHGSFRGSGTDFIRWLFDPERPTSKVSQHSISNMLIDLRGDSAHVETYLLAHSVFADEEGDRLETLGARYVDRFERREGAWRIAHRVVVHDWSVSVPYHGGAKAEAGFAAGRRGPEDPSYDLLSPQVAHGQ